MADGLVIAPSVKLGVAAAAKLAADRVMYGAPSVVLTIVNEVPAPD